MNETLIAIALLCQITGTHNGSAFTTANYNQVKEVQKNCQKILLECAEKNQLNKCIKIGHY